jgi:hypothetical protein
VKRPNILPPRLALVIDTNILVLLIGYQCSLLGKMGSQERIRVLNEIRGRNDRESPQRFDDLWQLFRSAAQRVVTQHVIAEAYNLRTRLGSLSNQRELVWQGALDILRDPGIEEEPFRIRDLDAKPEYRKILTTLGPTDTGLLYIAEHRNATIITEDGPLLSRALDRGIRCRSLKGIDAE